MSITNNNNPGIQTVLVNNPNPDSNSDNDNKNKSNIKSQRMQCSICLKPNAIRYITHKKSKSGQVQTIIVYEHRDEPPIREFYHKNKKMYAYRRCHSGITHNGLPLMEEHYQKIITNPEPEEEREHRHKHGRIIQCPKCGEDGRASRYHPTPDRDWVYYFSHEYIPGTWGVLHPIQRRRRCTIKRAEWIALVEQRLAEKGLLFGAERESNW